MKVFIFVRTDFAVSKKTEIVTFGIKKVPMFR